MVDVFKINIKYLIPTDEKKKELFVKLKPGEIVSAKVVEVGKDNKSILVNIKGTEVVTETNREFKKGDVLKLKIDSFDNDKVLVKIVDEEKPKSGSEIVKTPQQIKQEKTELIKKDVIKEAVKDKIFLTDAKLDKVAEKYLERTEILNKNQNIEDKHQPLNVDKSTVKAMLIAEQAGLGFSNEVIDSLREYINKNVKRQVKSEGDFADNIKKAVADIKDGDDATDKGTSIINFINKLSDEQKLEFMFLVDNYQKPLEIWVKSQKEKEKNIIDKNNFYLSAGLELENMGHTDIKVNVWNKSMDIVFNVENPDSVKLINDSAKHLADRLEAMGYAVSSIRAKQASPENDEASIKGVNLKI